MTARYLLEIKKDLVEMVDFKMDLKEFWGVDSIFGIISNVTLQEL
jgi:hypothetical protein